MKTVLVVDDEPFLRDLVDRVLKRSGFKTIVCESGEEAVLHIGEVDALVTDFMMPGMTGVTLAQMVKSQRPGMPVLIMTGTPENLPKEHLADGVVVKPFDSIQVIPSWIQRVLL